MLRRGKGECVSTVSSHFKRSCSLLSRWIDRDWQKSFFCHETLDKTGGGGYNKAEKTH